MYKSLFSTGSLLSELLNGLPLPSRPTALCGFFSFPTLPPPPHPPGLCLTTLSAVDDEGRSCTHPAPPCQSRDPRPPWPPSTLFATGVTLSPALCVLASFLTTGSSAPCRPAAAGRQHGRLRQLLLADMACGRLHPVLPKRVSAFAPRAQPAMFMFSIPNPCPPLSLSRC